MRLFTIFFLVSIFCIAEAFVTQCQGQLTNQTIQLLTSENEALPARLALIDSAEQKIEISSYHVESGKSTTAILNALRSAAQRGVQVRLLFDGLNMDLSSSDLEALQNDGVAIREFHPTDSGGLLQLNRRMHSKLFVVDEKFLLLGSRNLRDKHFGLEVNPYVDFELVLQGDAAAKAVSYFDWIWASCHVGIAKAKPKIKTPKQCACDLGLAALCSQEPFAFRPQFEALVCCLHDETINKSNKRMQTQRIEWVKSARHSLMIETPYPAFSIASLRAIEAAAERGVRVQIFTNSRSTNDQPLTWAAFQNMRRRLLKRGVEIYEHQGKGTHHSKMFLVDGQFAVLGSHNFDARSDNFNLEFCIRAQSAELTQYLQSRLECRRFESHRVTTADQVHNQPLVDRTKTRLRQITALLIRPLL